MAETRTYTRTRRAPAKPDPVSEEVSAPPIPVAPPKPNGDQISFSVYARMKRIHSSLHKAMLAFPSARGKQKATLAEWDDFFKNF
jgi:hypothetical protein